MDDLFGNALAAEARRPLTLPELRALKRMGFAGLATFIAGGRCDTCNHARASRFHDEACEQRHAPLDASEPARQPWEPRPARRAA